MELRNLSIAFVIAYESSPYAGVVRPFINWAKELRKIGIRVEIILFKVGDNIVERLDKLGIRYMIVDSVVELNRAINKETYSHVVTDDYIKRLDLVSRTIPPKNWVVYAQVLYGSHAIFPAFKHSTLPIKYRLVFGLTKIIPFSILRHRYLEKLSKAYIVIANSRTTETLLYTLYGIISRGTVYPPVDTEIFKPLNKPKKNQVMLYLGSHVGDTDPKLVEMTCKILNQKGIHVISFGNKRLAARLREKCEAEYLSDISDEELAKLYSESIITITPQVWEQFGYVAAESIACGTPVLAIAAMGLREIISMTGLGILAKDEMDFLEALKKLENLDIIIFKSAAEKSLIDELPFSTKASTSKLINIVLHSKAIN